MKSKYWGFFLEEKATGKVYGYVGNAHSVKNRRTKSHRHEDIRKYMDPEYVTARKTIGKMPENVPKLQSVYDKSFPGVYRAFIIRLSKTNKYGLKFTLVKELENTLGLFRITHGL